MLGYIIGAFFFIYTLFSIKFSDRSVIRSKKKTQRRHHKEQIARQKQALKVARIREKERAMRQTIRAKANAKAASYQKKGLINQVISAYIHR